jgi:CHAT domain-containing protein/tetratricopeptide (TPR) repeat protein
MARSFFCILFLVFCFLHGSFGQIKKKEKQAATDPLQDSIAKCTRLKDFEKGIFFARQWKVKCQKTKGDQSPEYASALNNLGDFLARSGKIQEAEPFLLKGLEIRKKAWGTNHLEVAKSLLSLGYLHRKKGDFAKSESFLLNALKIRQIKLEQNHIDLAFNYAYLGDLYYETSDYLKAEEFFLKSFKIFNLICKDDQQERVNSLFQLGTLYYSTGNYSKAEYYMLEAYNIEKRILGPDHPNIASALNNFAALYYAIGNYPKAEPYLLQSFEIAKKNYGEEHPEVAWALNNLGALYVDMGDLKKAEPYWIRALEIFVKVLGPDHADVAIALNNLGSLYMDLGDFSKAEPYLLRSLEISRVKLGEDHHDVAYPLTSLGILYRAQGNFSKSESCLLKSVEILKRTLGEGHPEVANTQHTLAGLYFRMNNYTQAEPYFSTALETRKKVLAEDHQDVVATFSAMAVLYWHWNKPEMATLFFLRQQSIVQRLIQNYFPYWSDSEKEKFYESKVISGNENFQSYCIDQHPANPSLSEHGYNSLLFSKGLLLSNASKWKHRIRTGKDSTLKLRFEEWEELVKKIAKLVSSMDSASLAQLRELQSQAETLEKELVQKSEAFATLTDKRITTWKDVQAKLKPNEAAIEMVRVRKKGIETTVTDTAQPGKPAFNVRGLSDTVWYAAYIVKPESKHPEIVLLTNGIDLEGKWDFYYQRSIRNRISDTRTYTQFWKPIGDKLGPATKRIYFSPDGVYNKINLNTLLNPETEKYLLDERDIQMVTNTRDLLHSASDSVQNRNSAWLVGFPDYNARLTLPSLISGQENETSPNKGAAGQTRINSVIELPGTRKEVENISSIIGTQGWNVKALLGENAREDTLKQIEMPRVLHIATHGFFQPDTTKSKNPLFHSGLLFTGSNRTLNGEPSHDGDDGILTAYEAMNLNLDNTDLVVLSACETGLGEVKNGEGVYGLQRAFKVSGARSIIMSLWKVDDEATTQLMADFYSLWLGKARGKKSRPFNKRSAFLKAQKELKAKYPDPYFWGAFVMVGE